MWTHKLMSPSKVDNFLQYKSGVLYNFGDMPEYTTDMFIDRLLGLDEVNKGKMEAGNAVHKMIELGLHDKVTVNGFYIKSDIDVELDYPDVRELWVNGNIGEYNIKGRIDAASATIAHDVKTTSSPIDFDKYINSIQWKMYCLLGKYDKFIYDIFQIKIDDGSYVVYDQDVEGGYVELQGNENITIKKYERLEVFPYPGMLEEVYRVLNDYNDTLLLLQKRIIIRARANNIDTKKFI